MIPNPNIEITNRAHVFNTLSKRTKLLITNKVTSHFIRSLFASMPHALFCDSISGFGMKNRAMIASLLLVAATNMPATVTAQEIKQQTIPTTKPVSTQTQPSTGEQAVITLLKMLDQVGVIIPGKGFKSFQLGQTREQLIKLWGKPQQSTRKILQYQLDTRTVIQFHGKKIIESIAIIGQFGSMARVNNGIGFGMTPGQVMEFFDSPPDKKNDEIVRYKRLGIEFLFENQALRKVIVFSIKA